MRIGIDFDRVLFNTDRFKDELADRIDNFYPSYKNAKKDHGYSHRMHAEDLGENLEKFERVLEKSETFLFEDASLINDIEHKIVIVSRGYPGHQIEKIKNSGVHKMADEVHIINGSPEERPKDSVDIDLLVDDKKYETEAVDVDTFHFDREEHKIEDIVEKVNENSR